jgi:hypothetical protein
MRPIHRDIEFYNAPHLLPHLSDRSRNELESPFRKLIAPGDPRPQSVRYLYLKA